MKVLLLRGNPRKTGYTQRLVGLFLQGLRETGAEITDTEPDRTAYCSLPRVLYLLARHAGAVCAFRQHGRAVGAVP